MWKEPGTTKTSDDLSEERLQTGMILHLGFRCSYRIEWGVSEINHFKVLNSLRKFWTFCWSNPVIHRLTTCFTCLHPPVTPCGHLHLFGDASNTAPYRAKASWFLFFAVRLWIYDIMIMSYWGNPWAACENNGPWNTFPLRMSISSMHTKENRKGMSFHQAGESEVEDIRQVLP